MTVIQRILQGAMRGAFQGVFLLLTSLAIGVYYQGARRTRDWVRKPPLQRALLLVFSVIWTIGLAALAAVLIFILVALVLSCFS